MDQLKHLTLNNNLISAATATDIPLIRDLAYHTWINTYIPIIGIEQVNYMLQKFYAPEVLEEQMAAPDFYFSIYRDSQQIPAGFASWSLIAPETYKLHKLYVLPTVQGSGIGRDLINYVVSQISERSAQLLTLNVNRHNNTAIAFYKKMGFTIVRDEDIDIGNCFYMNDHIMQLPV